MQQLSLLELGDAAPAVVVRALPLPDVPWVAPLAERVLGEALVAGAIANVVVDEYTPGQGIGLHHDFPGFGPTVLAVSLGSACLLDLLEPDGGRRVSVTMRTARREDR